MLKVLLSIALSMSALTGLAGTEKFTYFKVNKDTHSEVYHNNRTEFKIKITKHEIILMEKDGFSQSYPIITEVKPKYNTEMKRTSTKTVYKIKEGSVVVANNTVTFEFNN